MQLLLSFIEIHRNELSDIYVTTGVLPAYERLERGTDFVTADFCSVFNRLHQLMFRILDKEMRKFGESEGDSRT